MPFLSHERLSGCASPCPSLPPSLPPSLSHFLSLSLALSLSLSTFNHLLIVNKLLSPSPIVLLNANKSSSGRFPPQALALRPASLLRLLLSREQPSLSSGLSDAPWLNRSRPGSLYSIIEYE